MKTSIKFLLAFLAVLVVMMGFSGCITMPSSELLPIGKLENIVRLDDQSYKLYFSNNQTCILDASVVRGIDIGQYYQMIITVDTRFLLSSKNFNPYPPVVYGELVRVNPPDGETTADFPTVTFSNNVTYWVIGDFIFPITLDAKYEWKPTPIGQIVGFNK
jgi:hypothetical protein